MLLNSGDTNFMTVDSAKMSSINPHPQMYKTMYGSKFTQDIDRDQYDRSIDSTNNRSYQLIKEYDEGRIQNHHLEQQQ